MPERTEEPITPLPERILTIGASGYVGARLHRDLVASAHLGTCLRKCRPGLRRLDVTDAEAVQALVAEFQPSLILLVAALADVDVCERSPQLAFDVNTRAVETVGRAADARLVYFSTDYVFEGTRPPYAELDDRAPINVYGESKKAGEDIARALRPDNIVLRLSRVYGFSGFRDDTFCRLCQRREEVLAEDDRFSAPVLIDDVVTAARLAIERREGGVYNVAGPVSCSRFELHVRMAAALGSRHVVRRANSQSLSKPAQRPANCTMSASALRAIGWQPRDLDAGLRETTRDGACHCEVVERQASIAGDA